MTRLIAAGVVVLVAAETIAFLLRPHWALPVAGLAVAGLAVAVLVRLADSGAGEPVDPAGDPAAEPLQRWRAQTAALVAWADGDRGDWDRHLRPRLAREFLLATEHRDPESQQTTGRMVFGDDLWAWVDPRNVSRTRRDDPGPGREALEEILRRLERL